MEECIESLSGITTIWKLDYNSWNWQVQIAEEDWDKAIVGWYQTWVVTGAEFSQVSVSSKHEVIHTLQLWKGEGTKSAVVIEIYQIF